MTIWTPDLSGRSGPRYLAIADAIEDAVKAGALEVGARLPPQRDMAIKLGLTLSTVTRAYALAKQRGHIVGHVGRGSFVRDPRQGSAFAFASPEEPHQIDLTCFRPSPCGQEREVVAACRAAAERLTAGILHRYPPAKGLAAHRAVAARWMRTLGLDVEAGHVVITGGAQQALACLLAVTTVPGDVVLTDELTYSGVRELASLFRVRLEGVAADRHGMLPEALRQHAKSGARALYLQPTLHNPTTLVMPTDRRRALIDVARERDMVIVEDDVCGQLLVDRLPPLAALAPERTCYVTSMSKCLSPSLRVGFIAAPLDMVGRIAATQHTLTLAATPIMTDIVTGMIEEGAAQRILDAQRLDLACRHRIACEMLEGQTFDAHPGGCNLWLGLPPPWRADDFAAAARVHGVLVVAADNFFVGCGGAPQAVRVALSSVPTHELLQRGLSLIRGLLQSHHQPRESVI